MHSPSTFLRVQNVDQILGHSMYGDWALPGREYSYISMGDLARQLLPGRVPQSIAFDSICAKPGDWFGVDDFSGPRFEQADTSYPDLLVRNMPNPCDLAFRMIDGRRRLEKLRREGAYSSEFIVFEYVEVEPLIFDFELVS